MDNKTVQPASAAVSKPVPGRWWLFSEMDLLLFLSSLFSCLLVLTRIVFTGKKTFLFLIWNLFLALIPYVISGYLSRTRQRGPGFALLFIVWLLFIPNAFYIITDLFHLGSQQSSGQVPLWYDLALILSFVWNGLLLGVLSVRHMEKRMLQGVPDRYAVFFLYPVMWLNALGVYIGRYLRYNSWDLLKDPLQLLRDIASMLLHPLQHQDAWNMIFCYSVLMTLMYFMLRRLHKAL